MLIARAFADVAQALDAARALQAAGIAGTQIRVLWGTPERDGHQGPAGQFAGRGDGPVGTWANADGRDVRGGSFVDGDGHPHDTRQERAGSFADVDHDTITTLPHGLSHVTTADHPRLVALLRKAALSQAAVDAAMRALHRGTAILLVEAPDDMAGSVQALLAQRGQALGAEERQ